MTSVWVPGASAEPSGHEATQLPAGTTNALGRMLGVLGDEWSLMIIQQALLGITRYSDFLARLPISNAVLTNRLRRLTGDGLLERREYQHNPPRAEYLTTARGRALWPVLLTIWEWERLWVAQHTENLFEVWHTLCDNNFAPVLRCRDCGGPALETDVTVHWGPSGSWQRSVPAAVTRKRSDGSAQSREAGLFPESMSVLGNRWAAALLIAAFLGATRFTDFQDRLGAAPGSISERLQVFCAIGVFSAPEPESADRAYRLTDKGRALFPLLIVALQWAHRWFEAPEGPSVVVHHRRCGAAMTAILTCSGCEHTLDGAQISLRR